MHLTHGLYHHPCYHIWQSAKQRVTNPKCKDWERYGGRGIKMCEAWMYSFPAFLRDMGPRPSPEHSLERKNNLGPYSPENCVWATSLQQGRNKRNNRILKFCGKQGTISFWAKELGVGYTLIHSRLKSGWKVEEALSFPVDYSKWSKKKKT